MIDMPEGRVMALGMKLIVFGKFVAVTVAGLVSCKGSGWLRKLTWEPHLIKYCRRCDKI